MNQPRTEAFDIHKRTNVEADYWASRALELKQEIEALKQEIQDLKANLANLPKPILPHIFEEDI